MAENKTGRSLPSRSWLCNKQVIFTLELWQDPACHWVQTLCGFPQKASRGSTDWTAWEFSCNEDWTESLSERLVGVEQAGQSYAWARRGLRGKRERGQHVHSIYFRGFLCVCGGGFYVKCKYRVSESCISCVENLHHGPPRRLHQWVCAGGSPKSRFAAATPWSICLFYNH